LDLTKLDLISLDDIRDPPDQDAADYIKKVGKDRMIKWAKEHDDEFFATELDALLIANQTAFEKMVTGAVGKYHKKKVWKKVKDDLDSLWVQVELDKRIKFTEFFDKEYELWKQNKLRLQDEDDNYYEYPTTEDLDTVVGMQANLTKEGKRGGHFTKCWFTPSKTKKNTNVWQRKSLL
jgi:hypothetical protein